LEVILGNSVLGIVGNMVDSIIQFLRTTIAKRNAYGITIYWRNLKQTGTSILADLIVGGHRQNGHKYYVINTGTVIGC